MTNDTPAQVAVPDDVAGLLAALRGGRLALLGHEMLQAADTIEAQATEIARLRSEAETTRSALSQAEAQRDAALDACNQARLAFAGYVSRQSAVDKLDAVALADKDQQPASDAVADAAKVLLADDIAISRMAEAIHDGPLGADDHWFSAAPPQGAWCVEVARAGLSALAKGHQP